MEQQSVRRRLVFYIPGFDPFPARRYRELYRREGAAQAKLSGYELSLSAAEGSAFEIRARIEGAGVQTRWQVLRWNDLVKAAMPGGMRATYCQLWHTAWTYIGSGALWPLVSLRKGPMIASFYPVAVLGAQLVIAMMAAGLTIALSSLGLEALTGAVMGGTFWSGALCLVAGALVFGAVMRL